MKRRATDFDDAVLPAQLVLSVLAIVSGPGLVRDFIVYPLASAGGVGAWMLLSTGWPRRAQPIGWSVVLAAIAVQIVSLILGSQVISLAAGSVSTAVTWLLFEMLERHRQARQPVRRDADS